MDSFEPTEEQRRVIDHRGSHALVFAGPGTGKTETLARRFASLVHDDGVDAGDILVLTFSRQASKEMLARVTLRLGERSAQELAVRELFVRTFHSFCARLLDGDGPRYRQRSLLTPVKERALWNHVVAGVALRFFADEVRSSAAFAADALNLIAQLKGQGQTPDSIEAAAPKDLRLCDIATLWRAMNAHRLRLDLFDFRDLVSDALAALNDPTSAASSWLARRGPFRHILVDEFQDSDRPQLDLLEALAGPARKLANPTPEICFVGDVNQSIYRFRGATPENIGRVQTEFGCRVLGLHANRRSAQAVLDVANRTPGLDPQALTSAESREKPGGVDVRVASTMEDEIAVVCDAVEDHVVSGTDPKNIAVLLRRMNPYRGLITAALGDRGIATASRPSEGFGEDSAVAAVVAALRVLHQPDEALWGRLLTNPVIGFRAVSVRMAFDAGRRAGIAAPLAALTAFPPEGARPFGDFVMAWHRLGRFSRRRDLGELLHQIVLELDLLRPVRGGDRVPGFDPASSPARLDALVNAARDLTAIGRAVGSGEPAIPQFLAELDGLMGLLGDASDAPSTQTDGVRVMSIHASKGLEFDAIVVPQAIDGIMPQREHGHSLLTPAAASDLRAKGIVPFVESDQAYREEASLWYVALTRARSRVTVTAAAYDDEGVEVARSPFSSAIADVRRAEPARFEMASGDGLAEALAASSGDRRRDGALAAYLDVRPVLNAVIRRGAVGAEERRSLSFAVDRLSPKAVTSFTACPRRYFYQYVLRVPEVRDVETTVLGSLLHRVLGAFHEGERRFDGSGDLTKARLLWAQRLGSLTEEFASAAAVDAELDRHSASIRYYVDRARQYLFSGPESYLDHLIRESVESPFEVVACEAELRAEFEGVEFYGRADRIDKFAGGGLAIRDYKGGRFPRGTVRAVREALDRIDRGESLFGDAPYGLNLQTLLYIPGAEALYGDRVRRVEYIYFRGKGKGDGIYADTVDIAYPGAPSGRSADRTLEREEVDRVIRALGVGVARETASGNMTAFPTTDDPDTCRFCGFVRACVGPGSVAR